MKNLLILVCLGMLAHPAAASAQEQIEGYGESYCLNPDEVGTVVTVVSFLEPPVGFSYPFPVDFANNEYTMYFQTTIESIVTGMFSIDYVYSDCTFYIYEDAFKDGGYSINPPNAVSPSTFQNGTLILTGTMTNFERMDDPFGFLPPSIIADCVMTGGSKLGDLPAPDSWTMHGGLDWSPIPGYWRSWTTKIFFTGVVGTMSSSWGSIKSLNGGL